jgi:hypothetical protein
MSLFDTAVAPALESSRAEAVESSAPPKTDQTIETLTNQEAVVLLDEVTGVHHVR